MILSWGTLASNHWGETPEAETRDQTEAETERETKLRGIHLRLQNYKEK